MANNSRTGPTSKHNNEITSKLLIFEANEGQFVKSRGHETIKYHFNLNFWYRDMMNQRLSNAQQPQEALTFIYPTFPGLLIN